MSRGGVLPGREERGEKTESIQGTSHTVRVVEPRRAQMYSHLGSQYHMLLVVVE